MMWKIGLLMGLTMLVYLAPIYAQGYEALSNRRNRPAAPVMQELGDREYNRIMRETDYKCRIRWTPWGWQRTCVDFWGSRWW